MVKDFLNSFDYKIKKPGDLKKILIKKKFSKTILCHGNFDVVHPGHIRHLVYAKSKADVLVVSVTSDKFIKKGIYRPHIPQKLRALNLAALEIVDFVLIDNNKKPHKLIKLLKPDFFAKGYEYDAGETIHENSQEEMNIVNSYGGEMIFTPGDTVYSSSTIIKNKLPNIDKEKIINTLSENKINLSELKNELKSLKSKKIHVVGDTIIDIYTRTNVIGGQIKTPTLSVLFQKQDKYIGGAAIVAQHLKDAGADVVFTTILGNDYLKNFVIKHFKKRKIKINPIVINSRPTTSKNVIVSENHRILKIDTVDNQPVNENVIKIICNKIKSIKCDGVVLSDFRHGIFHKSSVRKISKSISTKSKKFADSQVATRWGNIIDFKNFDIIFPNEKEARFCLADQDSSISSLCRRLLKLSKCKNLILKLGERGLYGVQGNKANYTFVLPSLTKKVIDPVGAGDALLSFTTICFLSKMSLAKSSIIGSLAASIACEYDGNKSVSIKDVLLKLEELEKLLNLE